MSQNPKKNLMLLGTKPTVWEKPGYLTNSQLTLTSRRLSQNSLYTPDNYRDVVRPATTQSLRHTLHSEDNMELGSKKSVTFNNSKHGAGLTNGANGLMVNGVTNGEVSSTNSDLSTGSITRKSRNSDKHWYTTPLHLMKKDSTIPQEQNGVLSPPSSSASLDGPAISNHTTAESTNHLTSSKIDPDSLARNLFPLTLGAAYTLRSVEPAPPESPPAKGLPKPNPNPWIIPKQSQRSPSKRKSRHRPGSAHSSSSSASRGSVDKMYLMAAETPSIGSSTVLLSSPFQCELAQLRMERLRIEEEHLLEVKRQEELERIRGPQPKWYELKSPRFHYESHKNTEVLKSQEDWQTLLDYRAELERASKRYQETYRHNGTKT